MKNYLLLILAIFFSAFEVSGQYAKSFTDYAEGMPMPLFDGSELNRNVIGTRSTTFYTDRGLFQAANPGLPLEDFEEGNVGPGGVVECSDPVDNTVNDMCFAAGEILPGVSFASSSGSSIVILGSGLVGNSSTVIGANFFADINIITFNPPVSAIGIDLYVAASPENLNITITDGNGMTSMTSSPANASGPTFWGVECPDLIASIAIQSPSGSGELIDNIEFGDAMLPAPIMTAIKTDVELIGNGDGIADQGETFRYTVTIRNAAMVQDALMTVFNSNVDPNSSLVIGSVTTSQGSVTTGNTPGDVSVAVDAGTLSSAGTVTITYDVSIDIQNPATELSCQGSVSGSNFTMLNTDDPDTGAPGDATLTPITPPDVSFSKTAIHIDGNGNNIVDHGEIVRYTLMVSNAPNVSTALGVMVDSGVDPNAELVIGSVTTSPQGAVTSGNTAGDTDVSVNVGDLNAGSTVTIMFDFEVTFGGSGGIIVCQAIASGSNFMDVLSDDPAEPGDTDPTITVIPTLGEWGIISLSLLMIIGGLLAYRRREKYAF